MKYSVQVVDSNNVLRYDSGGYNLVDALDVVEEITNHFDSAPLIVNEAGEIVEDYFVELS